jgi:catechol 2,3-dioxygenase-like lactoylglutathione lyase family enzyme
MNSEFEFRGFHHLALVCSDMQRTVDFYQGILGMPLIKTIELPMGWGQHFFFDAGGGNALAFFWFPDAPEAVPGVTAPKSLPDRGELLSAVGSMNHIALDVAPDRIEEYRDRLIAKGIDVGMILNHDDSEFGVAKRMHEGVFVRSLYFQDPDGILVEFAAWTRELGRPEDVRHQARTAADRTG